MPSKDSELERVPNYYKQWLGRDGHLTLILTHAHTHTHRLNEPLSTAYAIFRAFGTSDNLRHRLAVRQ